MKDIKEKIVDSYFLIEILLYGAVMLSMPRILTFSARLLLMSIILVESIRYMRQSYKRYRLTRVVWGYILYLIFTILISSIDGYPSVIYIESINQGIYPIFFFFLAVKFKNHNIEDDPIYIRYLYGCLFMYVCALYLFFTMPSWYINWRISILPDEWKNNLNILSLLTGFSADSYLVGYTSFFAFTYLLINIVNGKRIKYDIYFLIITSLCMLLSQTRSSIFMSLAVLLWLVMTKMKTKYKVYAITFILIIVAAFIYLVEHSEFLSEIINVFSNKLEGTSSSSRYDTGFLLLSHQTNYIFGHGYGTGGNVANSLGFPSVTDCEYFKLFYETGIIGFCYFVVIIFNFYRLAIKKTEKYRLEIVIVTFYLLAMNIADPLSVAPMMAPVFWYSLGRVL